MTKGGSDDLMNFDPLQWYNNRTKSDDYPNWKTSMKAGDSLTGRHYKEEKMQSWKISQLNFFYNRLMTISYLWQNKA